MKAFQTRGCPSHCQLQLSFKLRYVLGSIQPVTAADSEFLNCAALSGSASVVADGAGGGAVSAGTF